MDVVGYLTIEDKRLKFRYEHYKLDNKYRELAKKEFTTEFQWLMLIDRHGQWLNAPWQGELIG